MSRELPPLARPFRRRLRGGHVLELDERKIELHVWREIHLVLRGERRRQEADGARKARADPGEAAGQVVVVLEDLLRCGEVLVRAGHRGALDGERPSEDLRHLLLDDLLRALELELDLCRCQLIHV
ncbi:MAG TPA: hypothetical protein VM692_11720, partial [Gammaproteobacteria bacterium]|nr:hypothetical protein [Gammaproteobacteria bacterium]